VKKHTKDYMEGAGTGSKGALMEGKRKMVKDSL
jgi:hypothetical protein